MKIELNIKNTENIGDLTPSRIKHYEDIVTAVISSGALDGIRGGKAILHFDASGVFQGVQLEYWPWRRKKID